MILLALAVAALGQAAQPCELPDGLPLLPSLPPWMLEEGTYERLQTLVLAGEEGNEAAVAALRAVPEYAEFEKEIQKEIQKADQTGDDSQAGRVRVVMTLWLRVAFDAIRNPSDDRGERAYSFLHALLESGEPCSFTSIVASIPTAIPNLIVALRNERPPEGPWESYRSLRLLALFGPHAAPAASAIAEKLASADPDPAEQAAKTLAKIGPGAHEALPDLLTAATASEPRLRAAAIEALVAVAPASDAVSGAIDQAIEDPDPHVRAAARRAQSLRDR